MLSSDKSNIFVSIKVHLASVYEKILSMMGVGVSGSEVNLSSVEVGSSCSEVNLSSVGVGSSCSEVNLSSGEVALSSSNLSSSKVNLSGSKVNLSSGKVGSSGSEVILSKILILKSIVCCVCVMFSSDVSWGMENNKKVVLLGDNNVGKTQIIQQKTHNRFNKEHKGTIGVEYHSCDVEIPKTAHTQNIQWGIWDTTGQAIYSSTINSFLKGVDAFVFVYDITNKESFDNVPTWIKLAKDNADKEAVYFLVGNKADLNDERKVTTEDAQNFAKENNMTFLEVSAKNKSNIKELFEEIARACIKKHTEDHEDENTKTNEYPTLNETKNEDINMPQPGENKRCNCCPCNKDKKE